MFEALEIPLKDLEKWLEQETASIVEPLKAEGTGLLDDVKGKLDGVREVCEKLLEDGEKEMLKGSPKTYRRARVAYRLARNVLETIDKLTVPDVISHESLQTLCEDLEKMLVEVGWERGMWFPRISPYFIIDRRRFDAAFKKTVESLEQLRSFSSHKYAKAKNVEDSFSMIDELLQSLDDLDEVKRRKKQMELRKEALKKKITENQQKIALIQSKGEVSELVQIKEKIKDLERKVKHHLRYLQKPFLKFQSLARSPDYHLPFDEVKKLDEYLNAPFEALATEGEGYPALKSLLRRIDDVIAQGKLKLKSRRLRKAREQINSILSEDSLIPLHRSCKEAFFQRQRLLTSEVIAASRNELVRLQKDLRDLKKRKELVDSRGTVLDGGYKRMLEKIENQKKELEKTVLELTNKNVQVTL